MPGQDPDHIVGKTLNYAVLMHADEIRKEQIDHYTSIADAVALSGDKELSRRIRAELARATDRAFDPTVRVMDKSANGGRY